jgi:hypothetical protein
MALTLEEQDLLVVYRLEGKRVAQFHAPGERVKARPAKKSIALSSGARQPLDQIADRGY